ncbi:hypothetical protein OF83DRAFT_1142388 [Amylostereum chailletii]|nr:hypothetical protein OF83DRAFT_1142388 [Amylostereum chailletii]
MRVARRPRGPIEGHTLREGRNKVARHAVHRQCRHRPLAPRWSIVQDRRRARGRRRRLRRCRQPARSEAEDCGCFSESVWGVEDVEVAHGLWGNNRCGGHRLGGGHRPSREHALELRAGTHDVRVLVLSGSGRAGLRTGQASCCTGELDAIPAASFILTVASVDRRIQEDWERMSGVNPWRYSWKGSATNGWDKRLLRRSCGLCTLELQ